MRRARTVFTLVAVCCVGSLMSATRSAQAQVGLRSPTLSPWLNLYRLDPGPLGPYLSDVRPRQQLRQTLQQHQSYIARQGSSLRTLGQQVQQFGQTGSIRPTGAASGFMNFSHYYRVSGSGVVSRSAPTWHPRPVQYRGYGGL